MVERLSYIQIRVLAAQNAPATRSWESSPETAYIPRLLADAARKAGVKKIIAAAFTDETDPVLAQHVDLIEWMRVGQLNRLLKFFNATQSSSRDHGRTDRAEKPV